MQNKPQDLEDLEHELLQNSDVLLLQLHQLQTQKLHNTVQQFEEDCRRQSRQHLAKEFAKLDQEYEQDKQEVEMQLQERLARLMKSQQQCSKQIGNYELILEDLSRKRASIQSNFQQAISELKGQHDRHVGEWKKSASEFVKKSTRVVV